MKLGVFTLSAWAVAGPACGQALFFADVFFPTSGDGNVQRVSASGQGLQPLVPTGPGVRSVAVDAAGGKVYWCDADNFKISRANLDGSSAQDIITTGLAFPSAIALDTVHGKIYWGDQSSEEIWRANLDGQGAEMVLPTPFHRGLAIDAANNRMYWTTSRTVTGGDIWRATLDGADAQVVVNGQQSFKPAVVAIDVARNRMFFTDYVTKTLKRSALDGSGVVTLYTDSFGYSPRGLAVDPSNGDVYWGHDINDEPIQGEIQIAVGGQASFTQVVAGLGQVLSIAFVAEGPAPCYANCDGSTSAPVLNVNDFTCFLNRYAAGESYANCDQSSGNPVLNVNDFICYLNVYAAGCG